MKKKRTTILVVSLPVAYLILTMGIMLMAQHDYDCVKEGRRPTFTFSGVGMADGGSREYTGLLYIVISNHGYSIAPRPDWATSDGWAYDVGPSLHYAIPALCPWWNDKEEVETKIDELHYAIWKQEQKMSTRQDNPSPTGAD